MSGCEACNWKIAPVYEAKKLSLTLIKEGRFGYLAECPLCRATWYQSDCCEKPDFLPTQDREMLDRWMAKPLTASEEVLKRLQKIGAGREPFTGVPCVATTLDGRRRDFCQVQFQRHPPLSPDHSKKNTLFIDEVASVEPSEYALSRGIRQAMERGDDTWSPGTSNLVFVGPYLLQTSDRKRKYMFSCTFSYFSDEPYKGKDLILVGKEPLWEEGREHFFGNERIKNVPGMGQVIDYDIRPIQITWIVADPLSA
jgi:hypothetical protein